MKKYIKKLKLNDYILYTAIIVLGIAADRFTKLLAVKFLKPIITAPLIDGVLHLTYVENRGAAFGMLAESRWVFLTVSSISIIAMMGFLYLGFSEKKGYTVPIAIIISGGIGNMIDRVMHGYVVDFIDFRLIDFAVFNGADAFVCVGAALLVVMLLIDIYRDIKKGKKS